MSVRSLGILQILLSGLCFGFLGTFGRWAYEAGVAPQELLGLRFLLAAIFMAAFIGYRTGFKSLIVNQKAFFHCLVLGVLGYAVFSSFYFLAIQKLSITLAVLLLYTFPFWVVLGGWYFLKEKLSIQQVLIFPLAILGLVLLIGVDLEKYDIAGLTFGFGAAITYAIYILLSRGWLRNSDPYIAVFYIQLFAGLILFAVSFSKFQRVLDIISTSYISIIGLALICSVLAMALFQSGLQKIRSWEASLLSTTEPLVSMSLAVVLFSENLLWSQLLGSFLLLLSFVLISLG